MKRLLFFAFVLLVLLTAGFAKSLEDRVVSLQVQEDAVRVSESFTLSFATDTEVAEFENLVSLGRSELAAWKNFFAAIEPAVTGNKTRLSIVAKRDALGFGRVTLEYSAEGLVSPAGEEGRLVKKQLDQKRLAFYDAETGVFAVPSKTVLQITVGVKQKSFVEEPEKYITVVPQAFFLGPYVDVKANTVTFMIRGPVSTKEFVFLYKAEKGISELDIQRILDSVYTFAFTNPITTLLILTVIVLASIYRRAIIALVSESFAGEEEVEQPKWRL